MDLDMTNEASEALSEPSLLDLDLLNEGPENTKDPTIQQIASEVERGVPVRDRRWRLQTYKNCFVGIECVDFMVRSQLVETRSQAVELGRRLATEINLFEHVTQAHEFKDEYLFYKFVEGERRISQSGSLNFHPEDSIDPSLEQLGEQLKRDLEVKKYKMHNMKVYKECFLASDAITYMVNEGMTETRQDAEALGQRLDIELNLWYAVGERTSFRDGHFLFRFQKPPNSENTSTRSSVGSGNATNSQLLQLGNLLKRGLKVKSRTYRLKTYKKCFIAKHAVDFMITEGFCKSREEAVQMGLTLQHDMGLWHHVCDDHDFKDEYLFFRFSATEKDSISDCTSSIISGESSLNESFWSAHDISDIKSMFLRGVSVRDRTFKLKKYKNCFVGSEAVDFMVQAKLASSRDDAVQVGRQLMNKFDLFHHVRYKNDFEDSYLFYRFSQEHTSSYLYESSTDTSESGITPEAFSDVSHLSDRGKEELMQIGERLRKGVRIQNRQYRFKTYRNCFVASEAVDFLVQSHIATSRSHAVFIGRQLQEELSLLHHVLGEHQFKDEFLFFRFDSGDLKHDILARTVKKSISEFQPAVPQFVESLHIEYNSNIRRDEAKRLKTLYGHIREGVSMVLIEGPSGSGKRTLVTYEFLNDPSVLFASAKCESNENAPFATLRLLFSDLYKQLLSKKHIQEKLITDMKETHQLALIVWIPEIVTLFPQAANVVDSSTEVPSFDYMCLMQALLEFCKITCEFTPIVFLLDDITSATMCTLKILKFVLTRARKNLLLCATQSETVGEKHHFEAFKSAIEEKLEFQSMTVDNLDDEQTRTFLSDTLHREPEDVESLAALLQERTHGNFFFLIQLLESLQQKNLLLYDFARLRWTFSVENIGKYTDVSENVGKLLAAKIQQQPPSVEQTLKLGSCFGTTFDPEILKATKSVLFVFDDVSYTLSEACKEDLLICISDREYKFAHSEIKDAAYELLPKGEERKRIHWELGLKLSKKPSLITDQDFLFACADQLLQSEDVMISSCKDDMRSHLAHLFYVAGKNAVELSAFAVGSKYFTMGIQLLGKSPKDAFIHHYESAVQLFTAHAQSQLSVGSISESRSTAEALLHEAKRLEDKREASLTLFRCYTAESRMLEQLEFATNLLESAGHKFPKDPNSRLVRLEWEKAKMAIKKSENILSLPHMTDKNIDFCYDILTDLILTSEVAGSTFDSFATARMMLMTTKYGLSKFTPLILVLVGLDLIANNNDLKAGNRAIQLGFKIQDEVGDRMKGRVLTQACMAGGCTQSVSNVMYLALEGYKASMETGDIQNAFHGARVYMWSFYYSGLPFRPLLEDIEKFALQMLEYQQFYMFRLVTPLFQLLLNLKGDSDNPYRIEEGRAYQMTEVNYKIEDSDPCWEFIRSYGMELSFYFGDTERATEYYKALRDHDIGFRKASLMHHSRLFFFALINIENHRRTKKVHFKVEATKLTNFLRSIVEQGGVNVNQKFQILQAELRSLAPKQTKDVIRMYEKAIVLAARTGFLQDCALGNYLCANFCLSHPDTVDSAQRFLTAAYEQYVTWGATEVASSVQRRHPEYFPARDSMLLPHRRSVGGGLRSRAHFRPSLGEMHKSPPTLVRRIRATTESGDQGRLFEISELNDFEF